LALALPILVPTLDVTLLDGNGPGKREIQVADPLVDLRRDLNRGVDIPLMWVTTPVKNPTYLHQNHPVVEALRLRHGRDLLLAGVVLAPEPVAAAEKELVSAHAARLCALAGIDGAVVTKEGGGNADAPLVAAPGEA
jgi:hypothetical protein